eukprot:m.53549 g.53549  ORF g.53549 m.53549 type:complete len:650 (-) comp11043_c2_seq10:2355-4304(-)
MWSTEIGPVVNHNDEFEDEPYKKNIKFPSCSDVLFTVFPVLSWLPDYRNGWKEKLSGDLRAGLTIGILLIPQGLAYALLAELPVQYGLFSAFMPAIVYGIFGTSRELSVGPSAVVSVLTAEGVSQLYDPVEEEAKFIGAAIALALLVGIIQFCMGTFRLGVIVNFLSHPVLSGYTAAAALIICLSQVKHILGVTTQRGSQVHSLLEYTFADIENTNFVTLGIGLGTMAILLFWKYTPSTPKLDWFRKYLKPFPSAMVVVIVMTLISSQLDLATKDNVDVVGDVPGGLPIPAVPDTKDFASLLPAAFVTMIAAFVESMAVGKVFATAGQYKLDYNQELIALGAAGMVGSVFLSFPITGSLSRTAVNADAGAKTQAAAVFGVIIVVIALYATTLFKALPKSVLGAMIIVSVVPLIDIKEPIKLWKVGKFESLLFLITFCLTAFVSVEVGIGVSVTLSLFIVVWKASRPHYALEGQLPGTTLYRNLKRYKDAQEIPHIRIFRLDAELFFANVGVFEEKFKEKCLQDGIKFAILDMNPCSAFDSSALHTMHILLEEAERKGVVILLAGLLNDVRDTFRRVGLIESIGRENFFTTTHGAVLGAQERMRTNSSDTVGDGNNANGNTIVAMSNNTMFSSLNGETSTDSPLIQLHTI